MRGLIRGTLVACVLVTGGVLAMRRYFGAVPNCGATVGAVIVVDASAHRMALCRAGKVEDSFRVRIGSEGVGKAREGDEKTPLGRYPLGAPTPSRTFHVFIPIGYPTSEQRAQGLTGSAVGIHGPHRRVRWLGPLVNVRDTTDGCVGVATDEEIERVAAWVRGAPGVGVEVR